MTLAFAAAGLAGSAIAAPIVYNAQLQPGVPVVGVSNQAVGNQSNPVGAEYYSFFAAAGSNALLALLGIGLAAAGFARRCK